MAEAASKPSKVWRRRLDYIFGRNTLIGVASLMLLFLSGYATWHGMRDFIIGVSDTPTEAGSMSIPNDVLVIGVVVALTFLMWLAWNLPTGTDFKWFAEGGGLVGGKHPTARRFNGGQKAIYWIVVLGGAAVAATGYVLVFPLYGTGIAGMQTAQMIHGIVGLLFIAIMLAHIYIGTIGMQGAFEAMGSGEVDVNWARQHHSLWLDKQIEKGRVRGGGATAPAE